MVITLSGILVVVTEKGITTFTGSSGLNLVVSIKKVTNRKARSTMGVMSIEGLFLGSFIFGIA
jgi:hypothetical protein